MVTHEPDIANHTQRIITVRDGILFSDRMNGKMEINKNQPEFVFAVEEEGALR